MIKDIEVNGAPYSITLSDDMVGPGLKKDENGVVSLDINEEKLVKITYSELKSLRNNSQLIPGSFYRITDYVTKTTQSSTKSANHPFDVIVLALSKNTLCEDAKVALHEGDTYFANKDLNAWELKYCLDNDSTRFKWADGTNGKGVIYRMIDEKRNDCPYDFKNILFYNNKLTSGITSDKYYYTFSYVIGSELYDGTTEKQAKECYGNVMGEYRDSSGVLQLNMNVFVNNNTFYDNCYSNIFGGNCYSNTFGSDSHSNKFGDNCYSNIFGGNCYSNTFGNSCYSNTFGNNCYSNTFGGVCPSNKFGNNCYSNTFGNNCYSNTFGNQCSYNTFGTYCQSNTFGNSCSKNILKNSVQSISFKTYGVSNKFGDSCNNITFGDNCNSNTFGNFCTKNTLGNNCHYNVFGSDYNNMTFGDLTTNYKIEGSGDKKKSVTTLSKEFYDDGTGNVVPLKHPDLSTEPSILPYKFMGEYVYEQIIPYTGGTQLCVTLSQSNLGNLIEANCIGKTTGVVEIVSYENNILTIKQELPNTVKYIRIVYTASKYPITGLCGNDITYTLDEQGTLTITGSGSMYIDKTQLGYLKYKDEITKVIIYNSSIDSITEEAFASCPNLENVEFI